MAILVTRIVDTESLSVDLQAHPEHDQGILGSAVVRGRLTLFLDMHRLTQRLFGTSSDGAHARVGPGEAAQAAAPDRRHSVLPRGRQALPDGGGPRGRDRRERRGRPGPARGRPAVRPDRLGHRDAGHGRLGVRPRGAPPRRQDADARADVAQRGPLRESRPGTAATTATKSSSTTTGWSGRSETCWPPRSH